MTVTRKALCSVAIVLALSSAITAKALPITDVVDPTDTIITFATTTSPCPSGLTCDAGSLSFVHDISDDGFAVGVDNATSAMLAIHLTDARGGGHESYEVDIGSSQTFLRNVPSGSGGSVDAFNLTIASLADLNADGKINVVARSLDGSFRFADSLLTVNDPVQQLPEPAPLTLLGIALGGLGFSAWKSARQRPVENLSATA